MRPLSRITAALTLAAVAVLAPGTGGTAAAAACTWRASDLPLPPGMSEGEVQATDNQGGYAGRVNTADRAKAEVVVWRGGRATSYGALSATVSSSTQVTGMNRAGTVVGYALYSTPPAVPLLRAFKSVDGRLAALPTLTGARSASASGINDRGDVVGHNQVNRDSRWVTVPVLWPADRPGAVVELTGPWSGGAVADAVDADGTVLVRFDRPYLWRNGTATPLGAVPSASAAYGTEISAGRVVGLAYLPDGEAAVYWDTDRVARLLPGADSTRSINRDGRILASYGQRSWGVWRLTTFESLVTDRGGDYPEVISDDGTVAGKRFVGDTSRQLPVVWRCA